MYSKYQFIDGRKGLWHLFRLIRVIIFFATLFCYQVFPFEWYDALICAVLNAILFDIGVNVLALKQKWDYVGKTSQIDLKFGKIKWYAYAIALVVSIGIKFFKSKKQKL